MGTNDFGSNYYMLIHASGTGCWTLFSDGRCFLGHATTSFQKSDTTLNNTFSFWPKVEDQDNGNLGENDTNSDNNNGRYNNIATNSDIRIDSTPDRRYSRVSYGGRDELGNIWKRKTISIPKRIHDIVLYMRGWQISGYGDNYSGPNLKVCSAYVMDLWNEYQIYSDTPYRFNRNAGTNWTPGDIFRNL